ncbi:hypothetical protein LIER_22339 [Lithospermum erythrorhizon]|uniref:Uncharacterized protein n=1 Tax=Lithospermum erythrorhizon TaxID=34254 RepID=A0AAV3QUR6_LITER
MWGWCHKRWISLFCITIRVNTLDVTGFLHDWSVRDLVQPAPPPTPSSPSVSALGLWLQCLRVASGVDLLGVSREKQEETFFGSLRRLLNQTRESAADILGGVLPGFRKRPTTSLFEHPQLYHQQQKYSNPWPVQDSYVIRDDDEAPTVEAKTYAFMSKDAEKMQQLRQSRAFYSGLDGNFQQQQHDHHQQQQQQQQQTQKQQHHHRAGRQTRNPFDSWNSSYDHRNIHYRVNSMGYGQGY